MKCPSCNRDNSPNNRFCIYCGAILQLPEPDESPGPGQDAADISPEQSNVLLKEIQRLEKLISAMNNRLAELERGQRISSPAPEIEKKPVPRPATDQQAAPAPRPQSVVSRIEETPPRETEPAVAKQREWEQIFGGRWLPRIGALALVIGAGFFLAYAFDNNWIGPAAQVIIGVVVGLAMLGGGYFWKNKYPILAQAISGGGIGILYLSIFAAFAAYDLIQFYLAFAFLIVVSVASALLALRYNSMALAVLGIFGAFAAPFILSVSARSVPGTGSVETGFWILIGYIILVDIGVLVLSTFRNWRWFTLLALFGTLAVYGLLHTSYISTVTAMVSLTIIFLIFAGATMLFNIIWKRPAEPFDQVLMTINAAAYFGISYGLMWTDFRAWIGGFTLLLALFYGAIYYSLKMREEDRNLSLFALSIAIIFFSIAVPVQIGDKAWTTIAWAAEGLVLIWLSFSLRMTLLRGYGYAVFSAMAVRLMFFDQIIYSYNYLPVLNERFLAFSVSIAVLYFTGYLLRRRRENLEEWEQAALSIYPLFFIAANFFTVWLISAEVIHYFDTSLALTLVWAIYAVGLLVVGMLKQWRMVRLWALALLAIPILKLFIYDVFTLETVYRIIAFTVLGVLLIASGYLYSRFSKSIRGFIARK